MPMIHLFDDGLCSRLYPFHLVEGGAGIRHGAFTQRERWDRVAQALTAHGREEDLHVNSRWIPDAETVNLLLQHPALDVGDTPLLRPSDGQHDTKPAPLPTEGVRLIGHANDLFSGLEDQINRDLGWMKAAWQLQPLEASPHTATYGSAGSVLAAADADVRAASLDTSSGVIVIGPGARVEPGSHIEGPVVLCEGAVVRTGAHIRGATVIGPQCKVGGEVSNVHFQGWANKAHGGFLGNSVIGRWCNLGAGTTSSNLKNTYGTVRQWSPEAEGMIDSGLQFCGVLMGDHSKCGIGTTLNTGTIFGPACVVFDAGFPPKHLPPFSWHNARHERTELHDLPRMLSTADAVMARRGLSMSPVAKDNLSALFEKVRRSAPSD